MAAALRFIFWLFDREDRRHEHRADLAARSAAKRARALLLSENPKKTSARSAGAWASVVERVSSAWRDDGDNCRAGHTIHNEATRSAAPAPPWCRLLERT